VRAFDGYVKSVVILQNVRGVNKWDIIVYLPFYNE